MELNREYASGWSAVRSFLERVFVVFTVGVLFGFVLLRSEVMASVSPLQVRGDGQHIEQFRWLDAQVAVSESSRGQGEH